MKAQVFLLLLICICYSVHSQESFVLKKKVKFDGKVFAVGTKGVNCAVTMTQNGNTVEKVFYAAPSAYVPPTCIPETIYAIGTKVWVVFRRAGFILRQENFQPGKSYEVLPWNEVYIAEPIGSSVIAALDTNDISNGFTFGMYYSQEPSQGSLLLPYLNFNSISRCADGFEGGIKFDLKILENNVKLLSKNSANAFLFANTGNAWMYFDISANTVTNSQTLEPSCTPIVDDSEFPPEEEEVHFVLKKKIQFDGKVFAIGTKGNDCAVTMTQNGNTVEKVFPAEFSLFIYPACVAQTIFAIGTKVWVVYQTAGRILMDDNFAPGKSSYYNSWGDHEVKDYGSSVIATLDTSNINNGFTFGFYYSQIIDNSYRVESLSFISASRCSEGQEGGIKFNLKIQNPGTRTIFDYSPWIINFNVGTAWMYFDINTNRVTFDLTTEPTCTTIVDNSENFDDVEEEEVEEDGEEEEAEENEENEENEEDEEDEEDNVEGSSAVKFSIGSLIISFVSFALFI